MADKARVDSPPGQYLTFRMARQDFAMAASCIRGILPARDMERVSDPAPNLARFFGEWLCGFASVNGRDFPVIDLPAKLGLPHSTRGRNPCIVAVEIPTPDGPRLAGFLADRVSDVVDARERDLQRGKLHTGGRTRPVLDPSSLLNL